MTDRRETTVAVLWGDRAVTLTEAEARGLLGRFGGTLAGEVLRSRMMRALKAPPGEGALDLNREEIRSSPEGLRDELRACIAAEDANGRMTDGLRALAEMLEEPWRPLTS